MLGEYTCSVARSGSSLSAETHENQTALDFVSRLIAFATARRHRGSTFRNRVEAMGIMEVVSAPRSPWQNAFVKRPTSAVCAASFRRTSTTTTERARIFTRQGPPESSPLIHPGLEESSPSPPRVSGPHHRYERLAPDYVTVLASPTTASRPISRRLRFSVWRSVDLRRWPTVQLSDRGRFTSRTYSSECMPLLKLWLRWNLLATNFAGLAQVSFSLDRQVLLALKSLQWCTFRQNNHIAVTTSRTAAATH
jgi:hypothetical protein